MVLAALDVLIEKNSNLAGDLAGALMADPTGEGDKGGLRLDFDYRRWCNSSGPRSTIMSEAGLLLPCRELDIAWGISESTPADACTGKNGRHRPVGRLRQPVFGGRPAIRV